MIKNNVVAKFKYYLNVHDNQWYDLGVFMGHCRMQPWQLMDSQRYMSKNSTFNVLFVF